MYLSMYNIMYVSIHNKYNVFKFLNCQENFWLLDGVTENCDNYLLGGYL